MKMMALFLQGGLALKKPKKTDPAATPVAVSEDPRYKKFFKMLTMHVPKDAVKAKMEASGFDPSILDLDPSAPPPGKSLNVRDMASWDPDSTWGRIEGQQIFADVNYAVGPPAAGATRFVCISDTHGLHRGVAIPRGDVLVHAGDFTNTGEESQVEDFARWLVEEKQKGGFSHVVVIAGNHDITMQEDYYHETGKDRFHRHTKTYDPKRVREILTKDYEQEITYLEDALLTLPNGCRIWGSPWQPEFCDWAFNLPRGQACRQIWDRIPENVDVLMTHGPALGRGDLCSSGNRAGCVDLLEQIQSRIRPRVHVVGHIHEAFGVSSDGTTAFINASTCTSQYKSIHPAVVFDLPPSASSASTAEARSAAEAPVFIRSALENWSPEQVNELVDDVLATTSDAPATGEFMQGAVPPDCLMNLRTEMLCDNVDSANLRINALGAFRGKSGQELLKHLRKNKACLPETVTRLVRHLEASQI